MALTLTAGAAPIFLSKNYFSKDANVYGGTFTVTSSSALGPRLYDMDPFAFWLSSGSTDGDSQVLMSQLYEGYAIAQRTVKFFAMLNTNAKNFVVEYSTDNGSTWTNVVTVTGNTAPNYLYELPAEILLVSAWRVTITTTFAITGLAAGGEKKVGTICVHNVLYQTSQPPEKLKRIYYSNAKIVVLADYSEDITRTKRSPASHQFYGCELSYANLPDEDRDALRTVDRENPNFCLMPEPGDRLGDLFYGRFVGDWQDEPTDEFKGAGNSVTLSFKETSS